MLQIMNMRMGFPFPLRNVVIDYFSPTPFILHSKGQGNSIRVSIICNPRRGLLSCGCCKSWTRGCDSLVPSAMWGLFFSLLRQEYPQILTSGEMLSKPGGWYKPIPEVIHLWRYRMSTPNNLEKSRLVWVLDIFCTFLGKNEKNTVYRENFAPVLFSPF